MKLLLAITIILFSLSLSARVNLRVLGVASILIEDENTKVLFDAPFTRPGLFHWLGIQKFKSNRGLVESVIKNHKLKKLDGVFISHSHFDHSVDAPMMAHLTGATLFADSNLKRMASAYKDINPKVTNAKNGEMIQVGHFKITPIEIQHEKILGIEFLPGNVPNNFDFDFYDYRVGNTWMYLVEHPAGIIMIAEAEQAHLKDFQAFRADIKKVDVLIQGISRNNKKELLDGYLTIFSPKTFIPTHFDNFFISYDHLEFHHYPWSRFYRTMDWIKIKAPSTKVIMPRLGQVIPILK